MKRFLMVGMVMVLSVAMLGRADALPFISGEIGINGNLTDSFPVSTVASGTGITFKNGGASLVVNVDAPSSFDTAGVTTGTAAKYFNFTVGSPISPLWTITTGGFRFDLISSFVNGTPSANGFVLSGAGIMHGIGYADTPYDWSFAATKSSPHSVNVSFTAQNSMGTVVPEPTSFFLFGSGLACLFFGDFMRKRNS